MALRAAIATGNFNTAGTWGVIDTTSLNNTETTTTTLTTSYLTSTTFTPGAITIDGIGVKLANRTGITGTMSVALDQAGSTVAGTEVTINTADLPLALDADLDGGWIFFKFATPVLLVAATAYGVKAKTSSSTQVKLRATSGNNWARFLRTTTTGAPAAGDDLIITGEYLSAGSRNTLTVTMDNTAATDFGAAPTAANSLIQPGIAISTGGTLTWGTTAATAYQMRMSNSIIIYSGGTMNMGTTGTPCPRDSSMTLFFDPGTNVDYGLTVRNLGTLVTQGLSRSVSKLIDRCKLNTDEAASQTTLGVDTDTGWLSGDEIGISSTTQTNTQAEKRTLNGNAGGSSIVVSVGLTNAHSGTSPTQAEVILLTRNVCIRGTSTTLQGYIDIKQTSTVDCDWTRFYWLGSATANKRGIDVATTTGSCTFDYCSLYDFAVTNSRGFNVSSVSGTGINYSNNVSYNINTFHIGTSITTGVQTYNNNICMLNVSSHLCSLAEAGAVIFTNNTACSGAGNGILINEANSDAEGGVYTGNTAHSNASAGLNISGAVANLNTGTWTIWRNASFGLLMQATVNNFTIDTATFFGNATASIGFATAGTCLTGGNFIGITSNGDSTFATTAGILISNSLQNNVTGLNLINCDFSTTGGIKTAHTNDINVASICTVQMTLDNTKLGGTNELTGQTNMTSISYIGSQKHDQTADLHKMWKKRGTIMRETTTVHTGSQSLKMTPNNASNKLNTNCFEIAVASGATLTPSVYVYEDGSYNGARARLIVKRNDSMGISADTVLDTATASSDAAWEELTGTTVTVTADGVLEFIIDCDGTAGNLFVDSFSVT